MIINSIMEIVKLTMFEFFKSKPLPLAGEGSYPLNAACKGVLHQISAINTGKGAAQKLMELGLPTGSKIKILQHQSGGGAVVAKGSLRIALGANIARYILVSPI